jgi:hypothetical protein
VIKQVSRRRTVEREEKRVVPAPRLTCQCCGAFVRRKSSLSALYAVLCRVCFLAETAQG